MSTALDMILRCAARQDVDAPSMHVEPQSATLDAAIMDESRWISQHALEQDRMADPPLVAADTTQEVTA